MSVALAATPIVQVGTLIGLMNAQYEGSSSFSMLAESGDFGLGTIDNIAGEMTLIDGEFHVTYDNEGNTRVVAGDEKTPFAMVLPFTVAEKVEFDLTDVTDIASFEAKLEHYILDEMQGGDNLFYVFRVDGHFAHLVARSMTPPEHPIPPLPDAVTQYQGINEYTELDGSLIIFKSPEFISPVSAPGFHIHFINDERSKSGHVYELAFEQATVTAVQTPLLNLVLPDNPASIQAKLAPIDSPAIRDVETR